MCIAIRGNADTGTMRLLGRSDAVYPIAFGEAGQPCVFGIHDPGRPCEDFLGTIRSVITVATTESERRQR